MRNCVELFHATGLVETLLPAVFADSEMNVLEVALDQSLNLLVAAFQDV